VEDFLARLYQVTMFGHVAESLLRAGTAELRIDKKVENIG